MIENRPFLNYLSHLILLLGVLVIAFPLYITFIASTHTTNEIVQAPMSLLPGANAVNNYYDALFSNVGRAAVSHMLWVSFVVAIGITAGKIICSLLAAFAIVYFRFPFRKTCFALIFVTLMLPVEVRISPTFDVVSRLGLTNSYGGLILPLIASATATFLFRQFFMTIPDELIEAARIDGASPMRFFWDMLIPLSKTSIAALFVIQFIYGWNQYLWPMIMKTGEEMTTIIIGIKAMIGSSDSVVDWGVVMASIVLAMLPPVIVILLMQKWFVKGLIDSEK